MIYLTLSHSVEVFFPSCYAISTFSGTPYMPSGTIMRGKVMSSEMTDVDRSLKTSALPVSTSSPERNKKKRKNRRKTTTKNQTP